MKIRKNQSETTQEWKLYSKGADFASQSGFKSAVLKNERFYSGDQWYGVRANNLPTPVFNIFKRIIDYVIAYICSSPIKVTYKAEAQEVSDILNMEADSAWERNKMDNLVRKALLKCAITGDMCFHVYWDVNEKRPNGIRGDFKTEIIDSENLYFGDVTTNSVSKQPYIIIAGRTFTENLIREAKQAGLPKSEIEKILPDKLTDNEQEDSSSRTTYLIRYFRGEDGFIHYTKSTRSVVLRADVNTRLTRYPIAFANWTEKKGSFHGEALANQIIPNQVFVNKMFAMSMKSLMDTAFPKAIYDKTRVSSWSNAVGTALGVNGDISGVAKYLDGTGVDANALVLIDKAVKYTEDCLGATDVLLGQNIRPDNAAALTLLGQNAAVPMENIKQNLYNFIEDTALIWLDFLKTKFSAKKEIVLSKNDRLIPFFYSPALLKTAAAKVKIDIGPSVYLSEATSVSVLKDLYSSGAITAEQYIKRLPKGYVPEVSQLLEEISLNQKELI